MRKLAPLLFFLLLLLLSSSLALANDYEWRDVVQSVDIEANGDVIVTDERTLWTDEDFGEAFICVELGPSQTLTLLEDSGSISGHEAKAFQQNCASGARGQEIVVKHAERINEGRVRFHYKLENTVDFFSDVVQWYWIIGEQEHPTIHGYDLTVTTPGTMSEPFDAYVHRFDNPEKPLVELSSNRQTLHVKFESIPANDGVEIRYLMDPRLFTQRGTEPGFEKLLQDEAKIAGLEEQKRQDLAFRSDPRWGLGGLGIFLALLTGMISSFRKYGREPNLQTMQYPFEPPSDVPPAAVTAMGKQMFSRSDMTNGFHATIMDLARRGYGEFTTEEGGMFGRKRFAMNLNLEKDTSGLEPFETYVLDYLKRAAASGGTPERLSFNELKSYSQRNGQTFFQSWSKMPRDWVEKHFKGQLITPESQKATRRWSGFWVLGAVLCGLAGFFFAAGAASILLFVAAGFCFIMIFTTNAVLPAWREDVAKEVYGWQGFKRTLTDYTQMKNAPDDFFKLWDKYFCYAAALGVAEQYLKNVQRAAPLKGIDETAMRQQGYWMGSMTSRDFASFSSSISQLSSALNAASASASSGGSSSGGGGGGGGGSSGGR
jgi:uncharacterized membrane protein